MPRENALTVLVRFSPSHHGFLASLNEGIDDPLYALVSRTCRGEPACATAEEIEAALAAMRGPASGAAPHDLEQFLNEALVVLADLQRDPP